MSKLMITCAPFMHDLVEFATGSRAFDATAFAMTRLGFHDSCQTKDGFGKFVPRSISLHEINRAKV